MTDSNVTPQATGLSATRDADEVKFTPGPWRHCTDGNMANLIEGPTGLNRYAGDDGYRAVCSVQACTPSYSRDAQDTNCSANIALIAAAPEMFDALKEAQAAIEAEFPNSSEAVAGALGSIDAVLRKASGEQP